MTVAQILLTLEDSEHRRRYLNARATLSELLRLGALPVINENDTVATTEIRYGDNDRLAARVAQMTSADCLLLLSDVAGLYTADPNLDPAARFIPEIREHHAGDRSHGRRLRIGRGIRRHGHQDRGREDRHRRRLRHGASPRARRCIRCGASRKAPNAAGSCPARTPRTRASSGSPARCARGCGDHRRRRAAGAALGQEPAAGRGGRGERALRARRYRQRAGSRTETRSRAA